ncbi:MAG: DUF3098 domain-containing protein [Flavobacteriaceae bacterium]|nr:hypothetical protein [Flavobacteriaceae bacterium]MAW16130.1 hypothetical protein [Flavobacteriaceae bacterium]MAW16260.1 hypothetical protein [Flavobacteriaceae bacterium]MBJ33809.1 hypothetical protein [Flavobacteriaceae bacterium]
MKNEKEFLFGKRAYRIMGIGIALIVLGFVLMTGGGSDDPNVFNPEMYSPLRIRLAPTLVLAGFAALVVAILATKKK